MTSYRFFPVFAGVLVLAGCATSELSTAPSSPSQPWAPEVTTDGGLSLSRGGAGRHALVLPSGFTLPSDPSVVAQAASPTLPEQNGHAYTLAELIDVAQSSNPQTRRAWNTARDAALAVGIIKSTYLPYLSATVVGGWSHSSSQTSDVTLDAGNYGSISADGLPQRRGGGSGSVETLSLKWLLFDFGRREALVRSAKEAQLATNVLFTGAHQKIIYGVSIAFYTHAAATARSHLLQEAVRNARRVQAAAEARLQQGQGTIVDVTQARQLTAQVTLRQVKAEGDDEDTYLALLTAAGVSANAHIALADVSGRSLTPADATLSDDMIKSAVARRPDVLAAYAAARSARNRITAARDAFRPSIFMTGNVSYMSGGLNLTSVPGAGNDSTSTLNMSGNRFSTLILGGITVPIFDGGLRAALLKRAQDQSDSADATLRQAVNDSIQQIVTAQSALHTSLSAYSAAQTLHTAAQTSFDAALTSYRSGVGSVTQTEIACNGLLDAQINQADAYYASLIAAASLAFATGAIDQGNASHAPALTPPV